MVDVGGRGLRVVQAGTVRGRLPVVFEAGLTATAECWEHVQRELAKVTGTIAYDRAGLGRSNASAEGKDAESIATDLHRLLEALEFPRPFVLVGHSMGGIFGRAYAAAYRDDVAALALVDASHPEQLERSANVNQALKRFFRFAKSGAKTPLNAQFGTHGVEVSDQHVVETMREAESWFASAGEVKGLELGEKPLLTITAPEKAAPGWMELQKELAGLSSRSRHVLIEGASHVTILTNAEFAKRVAREITALI